MLDFQQPEYPGFRNQDWGSHFVVDGPKGLAQITFYVHVPRGLLALKMSLEVTAVTSIPSVNPLLQASRVLRAPWVAETPNPQLPIPRLRCEPAALDDGAKGRLVLIALGLRGLPQDEKWQSSPYNTHRQWGQFPRPIMYFIAGPSSQEPHLLLGSPLYFLIYLCHAIHPRDPGRAASQVPLGQVPQLAWTLPAG